MLSMPSRKRRAPIPQPAPVRPSQANLASVVPSVREEALRIAEGDRSRIEIVSTTEVIVR